MQRGAVPGEIREQAEDAGAVGKGERALEGAWIFLRRVEVALVRSDPPGALGEKELQRTRLRRVEWSFPDLCPHAVRVVFRRRRILREDEGVRSRRDLVRRGSQSAVERDL